MTEIQPVNVEPMKLTLKDLIQANVPKDPFEAVLYYDAMSGLLQNLSSDCCHESGDQMNRIRNENITSENWELSGITRNESTLLYDRLRDEQPKLWFDCLTITAANAVRLLGGDDEVKKLLLKKRSREDFIINSGLTLGTARKKLTKQQQEEYIKTETRITEYKIVPKTPELKEGGK
jgi:hypothetical protein